MSYMFVDRIIQRFVVDNVVRKMMILSNVVVDASVRLVVVDGISCVVVVDDTIRFFLVDGIVQTLVVVDGA